MSGEAGFDLAGSCGAKRMDSALRMHRALIFGKRVSESGLPEVTRKQALRIVEHTGAALPCAILGSAEFVHGLTGAWQLERGRNNPPRINAMVGADWGNLSVIRSLRKQVFS